MIQGLKPKGELRRPTNNEREALCAEGKTMLPYKMLICPIIDGERIILAGKGVDDDPLRADVRPAREAIDAAINEGIKPAASAPIVEPVQPAERHEPVRYKCGTCGGLGLHTPSCPLKTGSFITSAVLSSEASADVHPPATTQVVEREPVEVRAAKRWFHDARVGVEKRAQRPGSLGDELAYLEASEQKLAAIIREEMERK